MKLKALKPLRYGRAIVPAGGEFDAARRHARVLLAVGRAEVVRADVARTRSAEEAPRAAVDKPKRTYKRRDLVAEPLPAPVQTSALVAEQAPIAADAFEAADDIDDTDA